MSGSVMLCGSSVATAPGEMIVVRMPYGFTSCRSLSESTRIAVFVADYTAPAGRTVWPATDETLMMCPDMCGSAAARVLTTDPEINARLARAGAGVAMVREDRVRDDLASGAVVPVREKFCENFPGYYLYYPHRRHASPALRAFVDYIRHARRPSARLRTPVRRAADGRRTFRGGRSEGER